MAKNNGGAAFPTGPEEVAVYADLGPYSTPTGNLQGMSLRDWFAGQVLSEFVNQWMSGNDLHLTQIAERAYQTADAMLKEREKD